jgi:hypothetical protein
VGCSGVKILSPLMRLLRTVCTEKWQIASKQRLPRLNAVHAIVK